MKVDDWFWPWCPRMMARLPRADWPLDDSEYWESFRSICVKHGVTEAVADAASVAMMEAPCPFPDQFVAAFVAAVKAVWASSEIVPDGLTDRESAALAAKALNGGRPCDDCHGQGFATRYRRDSLGRTDAGGRPVPPAVVFYCICPVGRWVERSHRGGNEEARAVRKRIPDLADFPALRDWFRSPPGSEGYAGPAANPMALIRTMLDGHRAGEAKRPPASERPAPVAAAEPTPAELAAAESERASQVETLRRKYPAPPPEDPVYPMADAPAF